MLSEVDLRPMAAHEGRCEMYREAERTLLDEACCFSPYWVVQPWVRIGAH